MPCHAIPSFLPPPLHVPQPETTCRRGKEEIRRHQCRRRGGGGGGKKNTWTELHPFSCVVPPCCGGGHGMYLPQNPHQMTLGDRHSRKDGRNERIRHVQNRHTCKPGNDPPRPPPPVSCGRRNQLALCNRTFTPPPRFPAPHTPPHTEVLIRPSPCRSSRPLFARSWPAFRAGLGIAQEGRVRDFHTYQGGQEGRRTETRARRPTVLDVFYSGDCTAAGRRKEQSSAFTFTRDIP